jgi:hypothetical protein
MAVTVSNKRVRLIDEIESVKIINVSGIIIKKNNITCSHTFYVQRTDNTLIIRGSRQITKPEVLPTTIDFQVKSDHILLNEVRYKLYKCGKQTCFLPLPPSELANKFQESAVLEYEIKEWSSRVFISCEDTVFGIESDGMKKVNHLCLHMKGKSGLLFRRFLGFRYLVIHTYDSSVVDMNGCSASHLDINASGTSTVSKLTFIYTAKLDLKDKANVVLQKEKSAIILNETVACGANLRIAPWSFQPA